MTDLPDHFCPGCGAPQKPFPRYPWYFCSACLDLACDGVGRALKFGNASVSGGLVWQYHGEDDWRDAGTIACLIHSRPVMVGEARFGGIVAEPLCSNIVGATPYKLVDLTRVS